MIAITPKMLKTINTEAILKSIVQEQQIDSLSSLCETKDITIDKWAKLTKDYKVTLELSQEVNKEEKKILHKKIKEWKLYTVLTSSLLVVTFVKILFF